MPERNWGLRRRRSCLVQAVRLGPGPENGRPRVRGSSEHGGATQLGLGGTPKPHSLKGDGQVPERGRPDPCGWESPGVCSLADPVSAHGPCQVRGWGSRHLFQARQTACASRVRRTSNRGGRPGRAGKGRKHVGPCQAITQPSANMESDRVVQRAERFSGAGRKGSHPPPLAQGHCGGPGRVLGV